MKHLVSIVAFCFAASVPAAHAAYVGGTSYQDFATDSPFAGADFSGGYFYLENFEDAALDTPGVSASAGNVASLSGFSGAIIDSVDEDDGSVDGQCVGCDSWFYSSGPTGITFTFNEAVLGALPTHAGIVWTDGANDIQFEAFDADGDSLGVFGPFMNAGPGVADQDVVEDTFLGVIAATGVSAFHVFSGSAGIEVDHLQYGLANLDGVSDVPVPAALPLFLAGLAGLGAARRRKKRV
ncbi:VPLPA-CTERM sorting domain-containing protein [Hyphococcus luteus]|uniref:PEP-CTERM protein-sorting domain-containing protein n=1 Tax=Hyphococcus luteus TaxID=2058213 RepID=A0A2S7K2I0_9PROT|nr:VPLPA-CTERM sorting domain-containing protein [Marinicaulis flavus]PQA86707.1 hypothetical protein CW354_14540 [Marinicaulis flavus]